MLEPHFARLRSDVSDAVRQPDFTTVLHRGGQVRRRRTVTSTALLLATVLTATVLTVTGLGHAAQNRTGNTGSAPTTNDTWPRMTSATTTGTTLYGILQRCQNCNAELYASPDGGKTWQRRTTPTQPVNAGTPTLIPLAPDTIAWRNGRTAVPIDEVLKSLSPPSPKRTPNRPAVPKILDWLWLTSDGGRTWRPATVDTQPVATIPEGTQPVDCGLLHIPTCTVAAINPATRRFAPLATQPGGITAQPLRTSDVTTAPGSPLRVSGLDLRTRQPAIATSFDAGRTWHTHVFTGHRTTSPPQPPQIAAGSGTTAYALTYRADQTADAHYTTDGGRTWRTGDTIRDAPPTGGFVAADGSHIVPTGTGFVAGHGTGRYTPTTLTGYPRQPTLTTQVNPGPVTQQYVVTSDTAPHVSEDGRTWRRVKLP